MITALNHLLEKMITSMSDPLCLFLLLVVGAMFWLLVKKLSALEASQLRIIDEIHKTNEMHVKIATLVELLARGGDRHD